MEHIFSTLPSFLFHKQCTLISDRKCTTAYITLITTSYGPMIAVADDTHLYCLQFLQSTSLLKTLTYLHYHPELQLCLTPGKNALVARLEEELELYESQKLQTFTIPYKLYGTEFQTKVWNALTTIAYGTTISYKHLATQIDSPQAARAVGNANNSNPIAIIIPCHRVVGNDTTLTGYAGGLSVKEKLLETEHVKRVKNGRAIIV